MDFLVLFSYYLALLLIGGVVLCICLQTRYLNGLARGGAQVTDYKAHRFLAGLRKERCHFYSCVPLFFHLWQSRPFWGFPPPDC